MPHRHVTLPTLTLTLLLHLLLTTHTCSASAMWPGDEAYGLEPLTLDSTLLDDSESDAHYAADTFTPLDLSLDEPVHTPSAHTFTPLSLNLQPPSSTATAASYHHFLALTTTAGYDESFYMSGNHHTQPATSPATYTDVAMSIHETAADGDGSIGVQYGGVLSLTVTCTNGSLTLLYDGGALIEEGDAVVNNDTFTFTTVTLTASLTAANNALSSFTFIPAASSLSGNVSCPYLVLTNQSLYTGQFTFDLTTTPLSAPAATVARVSFNLTVTPNTTQLYALYTGLPTEVAAVLGVSAARMRVVEAAVNVAAESTAVVMDFLPVGWHVMQANQNNSVAQLVAAFVALTPVQLSQTKWMRYVQPDSITQLCSDGSYRSSCAVIAPAAAAAAATAVASSLAFVVAMSVGGTLLVLTTAAIGWRYAIKRRQPVRPPLSPLRKSSLRETILADVQPNLLADPLSIAHDGIQVAIDEQQASMYDEVSDGSHHSRLSLGALLSARRASKRRSLVQFAPPLPGGAERLEMDMQGRLRYGGVGEGRRYLYQPQLIVNDTRMAEVRERRHTLVQQMEERQRERGESDRGSLVHEAYLSPATLSTHSSPVFSPIRSASLTAAALSIPAIQVAGGRKHLHYGDDDDSDSDDGSEQHTAGPKFIDAYTASASTSPYPLPLATSPSTLQPDPLTSVVPTFPHPSTFLPPHIESKRSSAYTGRRSLSGGLLGELGGEEAGLDWLHVGYSGGGGGDGGSGSGGNTPSLSTQDVADEWLVDDDTSALNRLEQGSPLTLRRILPDTQQSHQSTQLPPPAEESAVQSREVKRGSWARDNLKRQSLNAKRSSGRHNIVLDLSPADLGPLPPLSYNSGDKGRAAVAAPTGSIWSKLGLGGSGGQSGGGMVKGSMLNRPLMGPLMANAPLHHPRLSIYQQRAMY